MWVSTFPFQFDSRLFSKVAAQWCGSCLPQYMFWNPFHPWSVECGFWWWGCVHMQDGAQQWHYSGTKSFRTTECCGYVSSDTCTWCICVTARFQSFVNWSAWFQTVLIYAKSKSGSISQHGWSKLACTCAGWLSVFNGPSCVLIKATAKNLQNTIWEQGLSVLFHVIVLALLVINTCKTQHQCRLLSVYLIHGAVVGWVSPFGRLPCLFCMLL